MEETSNVNAGVHANVGMDFQKNCTIFLFLEKYEQLKDQKYFIILEHHDDIVFGFLDTNENLDSVESFQAKKSGSKWTLTSMLEIVQKIAMTAQAILDDDHPKTEEFSQQNLFITNQTIELKTGKGKTQFICTINETTSEVAYTSLDVQIKDKILSGNRDITFSDTEKDHFENLSFKWIDIGRTTKAQEELLTGKFATVFGDTISDHKAALQTFLYALKDIESTFNQGNMARLSDSSKRIESKAINELLNILTTKKKAYEFWRAHADEICQVMEVNLLDRKAFQLNYENSFDLFKDLKESEHRKIYVFVNENISIFGQFTSDMECLGAFLAEFNKKKTSTYQPLQLKAVMAAAYVEVRSTLIS